MTYQVGQQILNGNVVVVTVDADHLILSVEVPMIHDINGTPLTVTYNFGVTEMLVANVLAGLPQP